jgi:eukaryotic-like serine/threonine-protein kinase
MHALISGRYRLDEQLAVGGMAEVWLARDEELERTVALKLLNPTSDASRFEREARAAASLSHPNICVLYDRGEVDGRPFMVLEYLPGDTLETKLGSGEVLADREARQIATGLAAGLAHAHAHGVVHRDLKPANVLFDSEGMPKIADFGIAAVAGQLTLTEEGTVLGTAAYVSPEQVRAEPATPASDVYSFGVILYRMLTGRLPFDAANPLALAQMHLTATPAAVESLRPDAPQELAGLAEAALSKEPTERPTDGSAVLAMLTDRVPPTAGILPSGGGVEERTQVIRPRRRRRWPLARPTAVLAGVAVLAAAGVAVALLIAGGPSTAPASPPSTHPGARRETNTTSPSPASSTAVRTTSTPGHPAGTARSTVRTSPTTQSSSTRTSTTPSTTRAATTSTTTTDTTTDTTPATTATTASTTTGP